MHCQSVLGTGIKTSLFQATDIISQPIPLWITDYILGKKVSLIVFKTQVSPKNLSVTRILSFTIITYLKKLIGIKSLNAKQCPAGLSPRVIPSTSVSPKVYSPSYQKTVKLSGFDYHSWIFFTIQMEWELGFYFSKKQRGKFPP